jgi:hypothetical protein
VVYKSIFGSHRICRWFTAANIGIGKKWGLDLVVVDTLIVLSFELIVM